MKDGKRVVQRSTALEVNSWLEIEACLRYGRQGDSRFVERPDYLQVKYRD